MDVILLEKITNLGELGDKVSVKPGFARNFLIPQAKAQAATKKNLEAFEAKRAEHEAKELARLNQAKDRATKIEGNSITIFHQAGEGGKLFGQITNHEIVAVVSKELTEVSKNEIRMPPEPIRAIGEYQIEVVVHSDVVATLTMNVEAAE